MNATQMKRPSDSEHDRPARRRRRGFKDAAMDKLPKLPKFSWAKLSPGRLIRKFVRNPARTVAATIEGFGYAWRGFWRGTWQLLKFYWNNRKLHHLVFGLPALLLGVAVIYGSITASREFERDLVPKYEAQAREAFGAQDFKKADLYCRRLVKMGDESEFKFMLAVAANELGQKDRGAALMSSLAPLDKPGYYEAHGYEGVRIFTDPKLSTDPQYMDIAILHLERALSGGRTVDRRNLMWHDRLGELYLRRGQPNQALQHFAVSALEYPNRRLYIAEIHMRRGDLEKAKIEAETARGIFENRLKLDPANDEVRTQLSQALMFAGKVVDAVRTLEEGIQAHPESALLNRALANGYVVLAVDLVRQKKIDFPTVLGLLTEALKRDPRNQQALTTLVNVTSLSGKDGAEVKTALQKMLSQGVAAPQCHLILGNFAFKRGDVNAAKFHFEQAQKLSPDAPELANNLAWALTKTQPPDLPRALALVNSSIEKMPNSASFLDTRGQIYLAMGKYPEALADLQKALGSLSGNPDTQLALAEVYRKLGDKEMAEVHRKNAEEAQKANSQFRNAVEKAVGSLPDRGIDPKNPMTEPAPGKSPSAKANNPPSPKSAP